MATTYAARGRTVATAATAAHGIAALWNAHASIRLEVHEIWLCANAAPAASASFIVQRISARGTAGSTVTPAAVNDREGAIGPVSGALLDLATYTGQPTITAGVLAGWTLGAVAGSGVILPFPRGIEVPAGAGLALITGNAVAIPASDVTFVWSE